MNSLPPPPVQPSLSDSDAAKSPAEGSVVAADRGAAWWSDAWRLFVAAPGVWIVIVIVSIVLAVGLLLVPLLGGVADALLSPVLVAGVMMGCRDLDRGGRLTIGHLFAGFGDRTVSLILVGLICLIGSYAILAFASTLMLTALGAGVVSALTHADLANPDLFELSMISAEIVSTLGVGVFVILTVTLLALMLVLMAFWFAPALIVFRNDNPVAAMKNSFVASFRNTVPFLVYCVLGTVFAFLACIPLFLGWLVFIPVASATVYASYRDIFGEPA
jgi:uncharacterized membrane protein